MQNRRHVHRGTRNQNFGTNMRDTKRAMNRLRSLYVPSLNPQFSCEMIRCMKEATSRNELGFFVLPLQYVPLLAQKPLNANFEICVRLGQWDEDPKRIYTAPQPVRAIQTGQYGRCYRLFGDPVLMDGVVKLERESEITLLQSCCGGCILRVIFNHAA
jgi:hypothetical protein